MNIEADSRVTVVVLTHNRIFELERTVHQLRYLPEKPRIIVVDNGSTDAASVRRIARFPEVTLIRSEYNLGAAGRNLGVEQVKTPYVAFCDDDTWWEPGSLRRACDLMDQNDSIGLVNARVLVGVQQKEDPACERMANSPLDHSGLPGQALISFMAGACVIRTYAYRSVHGYEPRLFLGAEEALMSLDLAALGWRMVYSADVVTHHFPSDCRDRKRRRLIFARNRLWIAGLRLPLSDLHREARVILKEAWRDHILGSLLWQALRGLPWVYTHRRIAPLQVCDMHRRVFAPNEQAHRLPRTRTQGQLTGV